MNSHNKTRRLASLLELPFSASGWGVKGVLFKITQHSFFLKSHKHMKAFEKLKFDLVSLLDLLLTF